MDLLKRNILRLLAEHRVIPDTAAGQHFLVDSAILKRIIDLVDPHPQETIIEIGAGLGTLTKELAKKAGHVIAIEKDHRLETVLRKELSSYKNVKIVIGNALELLDHLPGDKIVSNTPYLIAEPLVQRLFSLHVAAAVLTLPRPFVQILTTAQTDRHYSLLSLFFQAFFTCELCLDFPKTCTYPDAEVDGVVITIHYRQDDRDTPEQFVIRKLYLQRTKKLKNALREATIDLHKEVFHTSCTQNQARVLIQQMGLPRNELETRVKETNLNTFKTILSKVGKATA